MSNNRHDSYDDEDVLNKREINSMAADAFTSGAKSMASEEVGKTKKILGFFKVDAGIAAWFGSVYNIAADYVSNIVAPRAFNLVEKFGPKIGLEGTHLKQAAAASSIATTVVLKAGGYIGPIVESFSAQRKELAELARTLAPVLDDIKGNHSVGALLSVTNANNEVIKTHCKRLSTIAHATNFGNLIELGANSGANLALDVKRFHHIWTHQTNVTEEQIKALAKKQAREKEEAAASGDLGDASQGKHLFGLLLNTSVPQLVERLQKTNEHKLKTGLQPYSALEMILELNKQVASKPDARSFEVPRAYGVSRGHRDQYPLEEYLMRICIQHQKDMADIDPNHSEIREALREDLAAAVKPVAEAIRKGDYPVMALVRLVGEGKIIKKQGRAIAGADEVSALIEHEAPKQAATYTPVDPAEYYKDAAFSREQLKSALKSLDGDEKAAFAAMFPDTVLAEAGMNKKDIQALRDATMDKYDHMLAEAIMGLNSKSDDVLKQEGLARAEIKQVREAAESITQQGDAAIHDLKTSAVNEHGIEHLLTNVVVHQPKYMGTIMSAGREKLAETADADAGEHVGREAQRRHATHPLSATIH